MAKEKITKTLGRGENAPSITVQADLDAILDKAGGKVERSMAKAQLKVSLQTVIANAGWKSTDPKHDDYGKSAGSTADVQKAVDAYKPGEKRRAKSAGDRVRGLLAGLSPEEIKQALKEATEGLN